jgi:hypothetical protein
MVATEILEEKRLCNIGSYEERLGGFDWAIAEKEMGWGRGDPLNIGWHLTDRICRLGLARKPALLWEGSDGSIGCPHLHRSGDVRSVQRRLYGHESRKHSRRVPGCRRCRNVDHEDRRHTTCVVLPRNHDTRCWRLHRGDNGSGVGAYTVTDLKVMNIGALTKVE